MSSIGRLRPVYELPDAIESSLSQYNKNCVPEDTTMKYPEVSNRRPDAFQTGEAISSSQVGADRQMETNLEHQLAHGLVTKKSRVSPYENQLRISPMAVRNRSHTARSARPIQVVDVSAMVHVRTCFIHRNLQIRIAKEGAGMIREAAKSPPGFHPMKTPPRANREHVTRGTDFPRYGDQMHGRDEPVIAIDVVRIGMRFERPVHGSNASGR
jgi:hypothetical protein